ncbi:peroxiredoxin [Pelagibacterium limicola]|uniref:peroxiredoxin n=1 Tax=Pelagibacterium limicola TaxID=2791022 RepID=UPI0018AFCF8F|nr:peroxiredoxin [Pelagibacterium limicola]
MTIMTGQPVPAIPVKHVAADGVSDTTADQVLGSGKVVLFTVPGAFTPTCHANHLPGYLAAADDIKALGVEKIVCAAVNDHHVMKAWAEATGALADIEFISDGSAALARELGFDKDMTASGMGTRFGRHALIIIDGVVQHVASEPERGEVTVSGAPAIIEQLTAL